MAEGSDTPAGPGRTELTAERARELLPMLEQRRAAIDQTMWQAPALSITAQAVLFAVALSKDTPQYGRITVLIVGLLAVLAALFSLLKQRYLEELHSEVIVACNVTLGQTAPYRRDLEDLRPRRPQPRTRREQAWGRLQGWSRFQDAESFLVWAGALGGFAIADVYLLVKAIAGG
jgi:hypothetical protein